MDGDFKSYLPYIKWIPLIIFLCLQGGILFFLFISLLSAVGLHEYYALAGGKNAKPMKLLGIAGGFLVMSLHAPVLGALLLVALKLAYDLVTLRRGPDAGKSTESGEGAHELMATGRRNSR